MGEDKHMRTHQSLSISTIESTKKGCFLNSFAAHLTVCLHARHLYEHGHLHSYDYKRERKYYCQESRCSRGPYTTNHPISKYHLPGCLDLINHYLSQPLNPPGKAAFWVHLLHTWLSVYVFHTAIPPWSRCTSLIVKDTKNVTVKNQDVLDDHTPPAILLANIICLIAKCRGWQHIHGAKSFQRSLQNMHLYWTVKDRNEEKWYNKSNLQ
jgi:hypothetical protein